MQPSGARVMSGLSSNVVADDQDAVLRHREIEFERGDADLQRGLEGGEGVFGREPARAAMALQVEGWAGMT